MSVIEYIPLVIYFNYASVVICSVAGSLGGRLVRIDSYISVAYDMWTRDPAMQYVPLFAPAVLTGSVKGGYIWNKVLTVGLSVDFSTRRTARFAEDHWYRIPGYADLGVFGEYQINKLLGVWLKGGNLLHSTNQAIPLYTCGGIYFTAGVVLTF